MSLSVYALFGWEKKNGLRATMTLWESLFEDINKK